MRACFYKSIQNKQRQEKVSQKEGRMADEGELHPRVCVLGAGIVGLSTARELRSRGYRVAILAAEPPLETVSAGAGGFWMPFHAEPADKVSQWAQETLDFYYKEHLEKGSALVEAQSVVQLNRDPHRARPDWTNDPRLAFRSLTIDQLAAEAGRHALYKWTRRLPVGWRQYPSAWLWHTVVCDCPRFLSAALADLERDPHVELRFGTEFFFRNLEDAVDYANNAPNLQCSLLINCCGLGAHGICRDHDMVAGRGGVAHFSRRRQGQRPTWTTVVICEDEPLGSDSLPAYVIPRGDRYVVGGTYWELTLPLSTAAPQQPHRYPHPKDVTAVAAGSASSSSSSSSSSLPAAELPRLRRIASSLGAITEDAPAFGPTDVATTTRQPPFDIARDAAGAPTSRLLGTWVGMRPVRKTGLRLGLEEAQTEASALALPVVHNYGHGGSGWTIFHGTAKAAVDEAERALRQRVSRQQKQQENDRNSTEPSLRRRRVPISRL